MRKLRFFSLILRKFNAVRWARNLGVSVGSCTTISSTVSFPSEPYLVSIGSNCQLTDGVSIYTHGGGQPVRRYIEDFDCFGKVSIGNWCYIGAHSIILPGVSIGDGCIVAAGSVITKSVPCNSVVAGNPAKVICSVDDYLKRNQKFNTHTKGLSYEDKKHKLMQMPDDAFLSK